MRTLPSTDPMDPGYRRLWYIRYADDHLLGLTGPKAEAEQVKARITVFLRETLGLELNAAKTLITRARSQRARFLGYDITVQHCDTQRTGGRRTANGNIALRVPPDVIKAQCAPYRQHGKPWHRSRLQNLDDYDIVRLYGAEYRGVVNYYLLAQDVWRLHTLHWHAQTSMLKTLAAKHRSTVTKMAARHQAKIETSDGPQDLLRGQAQTRGQEGPGSTIRRDHPAARPAGGHPRPRARPGGLPPQGADQKAPQTGMRALRDRRHGDSPPGNRPQASSGSRDRASPRGPPTWQKYGARPSSSAPPATTGSTRTPSRTRHKSLESPVRSTAHAGFGGRPPGKGPGSRNMNTGPRRAAHPTAPIRWDSIVGFEVMSLAVCLSDAFAYRPDPAALPASLIAIAVDQRTVIDPWLRPALWPGGIRRERHGLTYRERPGTAVITGSVGTTNGSRGRTICRLW